MCDQTQIKSQSRYLLAVFTFQSKQHSLSTYYACLGHPILCGKPAGKRRASERRPFKKKSGHHFQLVAHLYDV